MNHVVLFAESELSHCSEIILPSHRSEIYRSHDEEKNSKETGSRNHPKGAWS